MHGCTESGGTSLGRATPESPPPSSQTDMDLESLRKRLFDDPVHGQAVRYTLSKLGGLAGATVADLGCGTGTASVLFALEGARVVGVDIDRARIESARDLARTCGVRRRCSFRCGQAEQTNLDSESFDVVFSKGVLQYLDRPRALAEYVRLLKPGGTLILIEHLPHNPFLRMYRCVRRLRSRTPEERSYVESIRGYLTREEIAGLRCTFEALDSRSYHLVRAPTIGLCQSSEKSWAIRLDAAAARFDAATLSCVPFSRRLAWIVAVACRGKRPVRLTPDS